MFPLLSLPLLSAPAVFLPPACDPQRSACVLPPSCFDESTASSLSRFTQMFLLHHFLNRLEEPDFCTFSQRRRAARSFFHSNSHNQTSESLLSPEDHLF